jgi:hypothetical protein
VRAGTFSLLSSCPLCVLLAIVIANSINFADPDLWGHIRFGEAVLQARSLIIQDPYSYSAAGRTWHNHELGFEILAASAYDTLGIFGLKLVKLLFAAATIRLIALGQVETGAGLAIQRWVLMLIALGLAPQFQFRPQLVSFVATAALAAVLARATYRQRGRPPWIAAPIMAVWANFHGGFVVGLGILAVYCASELFSSRNGRELAGRTAGSLALLCVCAVATLANPYGADVWHTVVRALSNPLTRQVVGEWRPMLPRLVDQWHGGSWITLFYLFVLLMMGMFLVTVVLTVPAIDLPLVAVAGLMIASALYATRNIALALITMAVPLTAHLALLQEQALIASLKRRLWRALSRRVAARENIARADTFAPDTRLITATSHRGTASESRPRASGQHSHIFVAACAFVLATESGLFSPALAAAPGPFPAGAVEFMRRNSLKGNLLCYFDWGEYLIWHTAPESKVFIDGRYDTVYPERVIRDYVRFNFALPGAERVLVDYPHDFAIIPPTAKAYGLLRRQTGWRLIYQDKSAALFARSGVADKLPEIDAAQVAAEPFGVSVFP